MIDRESERVRVRTRERDNNRGGKEVDAPYGIPRSPTARETKAERAKELHRIRRLQNRLASFYFVYFFCLFLEFISHIPIKLVKIAFSS